jgi:hypothetical protein
MSFIKVEQMRICRARLSELKEEKRIIIEKLKESADPDNPGDYLDFESLAKYREISDSISAIMGAIKSLQGIDSNDIINEEETT